ncbi:DUF1798 family protein [Bacillus gobiensis]|uniref:DUF1798 family protein n=1 Tax=Bacillus gobiensis TaxID=1441095 RepID=UPI003D23199A
MKESEVLEVNDEMLCLLKESVNRYNERKGKDIPVDFYKEVQPAVQESTQIIDTWTENATRYISEKRPRYLHVSQIEAVKENLNEVVLQSFFCKIHLKRFKDLSESVQYTLKTLKDYVKEGSR